MYMNDCIRTSIVINPSDPKHLVVSKRKKQKVLLSNKSKIRKRFQRADSNTPILTPAHNPRHLVDRVISRQLVKGAIQSNILVLRKRVKARLRRNTSRIRILARRTPKRTPRTIVIVEAVCKAVRQRLLIFPAREEIRVETETRRVAIREHKFAPVGKTVEAEAEFGADVDDRDGVRGRAHPALRVAVECRVRVRHVREVVVGVEVFAVPARGEAHVACDAAAVESGRDAVGFAGTGLDQYGGLAEVGLVVCTAVGVAGDDAEALWRSDGVAHAGAVAWGVGVVGAGVVGVVGGHSLEGEEVEFSVVADAVGGGGPVA